MSSWLGGMDYSKVLAVLGTPADTDMSTDIANIQDDIDSIKAALGASALGTNYFVNGTTGSDGNDGLSSETPFATIQKAADTMSSGDACFIQGGTYDEDANSTGLTVSTANLRFIALAPFQVTVTNTHASATHCIYCTAMNVAFENFQLEGDNRTLIGVELTTDTGLCAMKKCVTASCATGYKVAGAAGGNMITSCYSLLDVIGIDIYDDNLACIVQDFLGITFFAGETSRGIVIREGSSLNITRDIQFGGYDTAIEFETNANVNLFELVRLASNTNNVSDSGTNNVIIDYQLQSQINANQSLQEDLKDIYDFGVLSDDTSTVALNNTNTVVLKEWSSLTNPIVIESFYVDYSAWATAQSSQTLTIKLQVKVDDSNYRVVDSYVVGSEDTDTGLILTNFAASNDTMVTAVSSGSTTDNIISSWVERGQ